MSFNNFNAFITAQLLYNISNILFVLIVNYFSSILWCEDNMIFAHPFCMCEYYGSNVPLFRRNGYRQSGTMIP